MFPHKVYFIYGNLACKLLFKGYVLPLQLYSVSLGYVNQYPF